VAVPTQAAPATAHARTFRLPIWYLLAAAILYGGWQHRDDGYLTPETGLGYACGIAGAACMLALLGYSLRKRVRALRRLGALSSWFRVHMALGVIGPMLILFHCNFRLGSINSTVAVVCMLLVVASGLVGRYFYARIHYGLYGRRVTLESLRESAERNDRALADVLAFAPDIQRRLRAFEAMAMRRPAGLLHGLLRVLVISPWTRAMAVAVNVRSTFLLRRLAREAGWTPFDRQLRIKLVRRYVSSHLTTVRRIAELAVYERLFALWHVLHVPLFVMLVLAGVAHVVAVHLY
jgi:hypothetical protein